MLKRAMLALALLAPGLPVAAQEIVEAVPADPFSEHYDLNADVSGAPLVGLQLGSASPPAVGPLYVRLDQAASRICVRAISQDGRYSATNPFGVPVAPALVRIPALSRHYAAELSQYPAGAVAVRTFVAAAEGCNPAGAVNVPNSAAADPDDTLVALVNGRRFSAQASLVADGVELAKADCAEAGESARIAYDMACTLTLPAGPAREAILRLSFNDGFADETHDYRVALPPVAPR